MENSDGTDTPSKKPKGFHVRMPPEMRQRLEEARLKSGRSVNAELLARIEASLNSDDLELISVIENLRASIDALNKRLDKRK